MKQAPEHRARTILWEIVVAMLIVTAIWAAVMYIPDQYSRGIFRSLKSRWSYVVLGTAIFSAQALKRYWRFRRSLAFWGILLSFLAVFVASAFFLMVRQGLGFLWLVPVVFVEYGAFGFVIYRVCHFVPFPDR